MDRFGKLDLLGAQAQYDICAACSSASQKRVRSSMDRWIYPAVRPDGQRVPVLKLLMSNACRNDCLYCATRSGADFRRSHFQPEELARMFDEMHRTGKVRGLFLSSAVEQDPDHSMERMLAAAHIVRRKYGFRGYVHIKVLPGASRAAIEAAARLGDRISINLEAPNADRLNAIAPDKDFDRDIMQRIRWIHSLVRSPDNRCRGHTTQFVVGAGQDSDKEIIFRTQHLYRELRLSRAYFSAYQPPSRNPVLNVPPVPLMREHRLYQTDFLLRKYGFRANEIFFGDDGNLSLDVDPKAVWAELHPEYFPIEMNRATLQELLRVPGIGPVSAKRIIEQRGATKICRLAELRKMGVVTRRAAPYVLLNGKLARRPLSQLSFWTDAPKPMVAP